MVDLRTPAADRSADCHSCAYTCEEASWDALAEGNTCPLPEHTACDVGDMVLSAEYVTICECQQNIFMHRVN